jgi:TP901 family phage tail tape measure protein
MADNTLRIRVEAIVGQYTSEMRKAAQSTREFGSKTLDVADRNRQSFQTMGVAAAAMGAAATGALVSVGRTGMEFQKSMNMVQAVTNATAGDMARLSDVAKDLGATTAYTAGQAGDAMYFLASAGFDTNQVIAAMPATLQLAAAAQMDLATAADITSNILSGYGMEVDELGQANDVLVRTFQRTNTNLMMLGEAFKYAGPVAKGAGVEFEEAAAAIGLMGNAGIQASMAGTSLRGALTRMLSPTKQIQEVMNRLGLDLAGANGTVKPLVEVIEQLETSGANTADMMELFGQRAGPAMAALVSQGSVALKDLVVDLENSGGTAERVAEAQMQGLHGAIVELKSATEGLKISLFESGLDGAAETVVDATTGIVRALTDLPEPLQAAAVGFTGLAGGAGLLGGATLLLLPRIADTRKALKALSAEGITLRSGLGRTAAFLTGPWGIAMIAATAVAVGFAQEKAESAARVRRLTETLDENTGALTENTQAQVVNELETSGAYEAARKLGVSYDTVTRAAQGDTAAINELNRALKEHGVRSDEDQIAQNKLRKSIDNVKRDTDLATEATRRKSIALAEAEGRYIDLAHAIESGLTPATAWSVVEAGRAKAAAEGLGGAVGGMGGEFDEAAEDIQTAVQAIEDFNAATRAHFDPQFAVIDALQKVRDADVAVAEALAADYDTAEERSRALTEAYNDQIQAAMGLDGALYFLRASIEDGTTSTEEAARKMQQWVTDGWLSAAAADEFARQVDGLQVELDKLTGRDYWINIRANLFDPSHVEVSYQEDRAAEGKFFRPPTPPRYGPEPEKMHSGGLVTPSMRPSWSSTMGLAPDEVPLIAQTGEWVMSRREASATATAPGTTIGSQTTVAEGAMPIIVASMDEAHRTRNRELALIARGY